MLDLMGQLILYLIWGALYHQNGSESGSVHRLRFYDLLFHPKNERKDLKSHDFRSFMVAAAGLEPAASGL